MRWRGISQFGRKHPLTLQLAARLGRGRGRLRLLDRLNPPPAAPLRPDLCRWEQRELAAAWLGHATVLLRLGGLTMLTDPVLGNRIGIGLGLITGGPRRFVAPALRVNQLPRIDLVLLSHAHFDHLDRPTLAALPKSASVVTAHKTADLVHDLGFHRVTELNWGETTRLGELQITAVPVRHWGARTYYDHDRGFNAYLLEAGKHRVLYGGDTAFHEGFRSLAKVNLAMLGIGAYDPWIASHASPEQAWQMADHVRADFLLPMHHSTFRLSYEPMDEPLERMLAAAGRDQERVICRQIGGQWELN